MTEADDMSKRKLGADVQCRRCRDTGIIHYLHAQGAPWCEYRPVSNNAPCDECERGKARKGAGRGKPLEWE